MIKVFSIYRNAFSNLQKNIWILSFTMFINRSGSMVLLFTSLYMVKDLNLSIPEAGLIMSFFGFGSVLGSYVGGWLTDRKNYFDIMVFSLVGSGLVLLFMLLVRTPLFIAAIIFFYAFITDLFRPANSAAIASFSTPENRTRSVSLVRLAINLGFSVGPAIGGFVAFYFGYKWLFIIDSFTSFAAAGILFFFLPRIKTDSNKGNNMVLNNRNSSAYKDYHYLIFIFFVALYAICFFQIFASLPQYFNKICLYNEDTIGLLLALNGVLIVLIELPLVSWLEKKKMNYNNIILGALFLPVSFGILLISGGNLAGAVLFIVSITFAEMMAMPFMMNFSISRPPFERQGQYSALYSMAYGIANIAAPSIGLGIAGKWGFDQMFLFFGLLGLIAASGFYLLQLKK